jgi:hypothetical protein
MTSHVCLNQHLQFIIQQSFSHLTQPMLAGLFLSEYKINRKSGVYQGLSKQQLTTSMEQSPS